MVSTNYFSSGHHSIQSVNSQLLLYPEFTFSTRFSEFQKTLKYWVTLLTLTTGSYSYTKKLKGWTRWYFQVPSNLGLSHDSISLSVTSGDQVTDYFLKSLLQNELQTFIAQAPQLATKVSGHSTTLSIILYQAIQILYRELSLICPSCIQNDGFKEQYLLKRKTISISFLRISVLLFTV